jgi:hypothetical protein
MKRTTEQIEMVETHNLHLSFNRLTENYGNLRLRRALYHALSMGSHVSHGMQTKIREALELP